MSDHLDEKRGQLAEPVDSAEDLEKTGEHANEGINERNLMCRVDWRLVPIFGMLYSIALVDRINLGVAREAGMGKALHLTVGNRYSVVSCLYFVPYILLQLPCNILLRHFGARNWISFIVVSWGIVQLAMGFVTTWGFLALCRVFLGAFEAGFFSGTVLIITSWYKRYEVQKRLAAFYLASVFMAGFSSIFAYALSLLGGRGGIAGWSYIFIIEGAITIFLGFVAFIFIPDYPEKNKFLTAEETKFVLKRVDDDRGDSLPDQLTFAKVLKHAGDWTVWAYGLMFMNSTLPVYAIAYFITPILAGMGWGVKDSLLLSAPPYAPAVISSMFFAWLSDRFKQRALAIVAQTVITIIGLVLAGYAKHPGVRYLGIFFANAGAIGTVPAVLTYASNNVVSHSKRSVSTAIIIAFGGIGGIFATTVFRQHDAPKYIPGIWATIGCQFFTLLLVGLTTIRHVRLNRKAREGKLSGPLEGQPGFYYTL